MKVEASAGEKTTNHVLVFRFVDKEHCLRLGVSTWAPKRLDLVCHFPGVYPWHSPACHWIPDRLHGKFNVWYSTEIPSAGPDVTVQVDGKVLTTSQLPGIQPGCVGFQTFGHGSVKWRNLEV
tara:strand:+ start:58415 stop:58780 length:366 start_codon:yes stop_codon:yes gene_type:complete